MKQLKKNLAIYICMFVAVFCAMTLKAEAANTTSGTIGDNDGITWTYDEDTKTLTITGEDSGFKGVYDSAIYKFKSPFADICADVEVIKISNCTPIGNISGVFAYLESLKNVEFKDFDTSKVKDMYGMFEGCSSLVSLDVSNFDTSQVSDMSNMFYGCSGLTSLDVSDFDTSQVSDMSNMFYGCSGLTSLDVSNFDTSNVHFVSNMFYDCSGLTSLNVSNFDTSKVYNFLCMFRGCSSLTSLDVSNFDTSNASTLHEMFKGCSSLTSVNVSGLKVNNATLHWMFRDCTSLESLDLSNFEVSNPSTIYGMFKDCTALNNLNLGGLDLSSGDYCQDMLEGCNALAVIYTTKGMGVDNYIELPGTFADPKQKQTTAINKNFCNTTLVNINNIVTGVSVAPTSIELKPGDAKQLQATMAPANAAIKDVTWKSSNTSVATVDANGKVTAVAEGTATITVAATDLLGTNVSATCEVTVVDPVRAFVERMYTIVLGRAAEEQGLADWIARLMAKEIDGATLVDMFVNSDEFVNRNTSDEEYIKILYRAVLGREADSDGLKMWKDMLADDWTRDYILEGLVLSTEFKNICDSYGIIAAFEPTAESQVRSFVKRMYTVVLNRRADVGGLEDWTKQLLNGTVNGAKVADGFINSQEFANRNLSNEKYVKVLYRAFFNREPDEGGFNVWMNELAKGTSRREVMKGFVHSVEFSDLCAAYGIIRGEIQ